MRGALFNYFDRVSIIHLPEREDRLALLIREMANLGLDIHDKRVSIPCAPRPETNFGFPSRGVYGNFLSHLNIIESAYADKLDSVLILEDDAIFSRSLSPSMQKIIAEYLKANPWDEVFLGHSVMTGLPTSASRLAQFSGSFIWSHCYAIHRRIMPRMIEYFHETLERDSGHPAGGKMYIDGAHNEFRRLNPDIICLVSSPCLSVQRGSPSSLGGANWYDTKSVLRKVVSLARGARDELWRNGLISISPPKTASQWTKIDVAVPWP
jgi:glycosyl transferase family 25